MYYLKTYILTFFITGTIFALRRNNSYCKFKDIWFTLLFWPLSFSLMLISLLLYNMGWSMDVIFTKKWKGFRKPDDNNPGFAITFCKVELQVWKTRKSK